MRWVLGIVALAAIGCRGGPDQAFDDGSPVHVILGAPERPPGGLTVAPVVTLGAAVERVRRLRLGSAAVEVATFRPSRGTHTLAVFDRETGARVRRDLEVERELWVLVEFRAGQATVTVFEEPPGPEIGAWRPLVAVPD